MEAYPLTVAPPGSLRPPDITLADAIREGSTEFAQKKDSLKPEAREWIAGLFAFGFAGISQFNDAADMMIIALAAGEKQRDANEHRNVATRIFLGGYLAQAKRFAEAEAILLPVATLAKRRAADASPMETSGISALFDTYDAWHVAEPAKGYDARAAERRAQLNESNSTPEQQAIRAALAAIEAKKKNMATQPAPRP